MNECKLNSYYCKGLDDTKVGFVFLYPGFKEEKYGKPLYSSIGISLNNLLSKLNRKFPDLFPYCDRYSYRIINSYFDGVKENNYIQDLQDLEIIICFGDKAYKETNKIIGKEDVKLIKVMDLSINHLNRNKRLSAKKDTPISRCDYKVLRVYNDIVKQLVI